MVSPLRQPMFLVTGTTLKSLVELPVNLNILFSQNIKRLSRNTFSPVIVSSTLMLPAPLLDVKSSSLKGALNTTSCGVVDLPA